MRPCGRPGPNRRRSRRWRPLSSPRSSWPETHQGSRQALPEPEPALEVRERYLHLLPLVALSGALGYRQDSHDSRGLLQSPTQVSQVSLEPTREVPVQLRLLQQLLGKLDFGDVGGGELVGEGNAVGGADEVQLLQIDRERAPSLPRSPLEARRPRDLARMPAKLRKQRRVRERGLLPPIRETRSFSRAPGSASAYASGDGTTRFLDASSRAGYDARNDRTELGKVPGTSSDP